MFPNAEAISNTMGLQPRRNFFPNDNSVQFAAPPLLPPIQNSQPNYQVCLYNQTAGLLAKLYGDLFPIAQDPQLEAQYITDLTVLVNNTPAIYEDLGNLKMSILIINQITQRPNHIPAGFRTPNADPLSTSGLSAPGNQNRALNLINRIWDDIFFGNYEQAQLDYGTLRNFLVPILAI